MATNQEALQIQARALTGQTGTVNEDLYAALILKYPTPPIGTLDDILGNVPGGLTALLADPTLLI